jgi:hypothetical protein
MQRPARHWRPGLPGRACAQKPGEPITLNFVGAEIEAVARTMGVITGATWWWTRGSRAR